MSFYCSDMVSTIPSIMGCAQETFFMNEPLFAGFILFMFFALFAYIVKLDSRTALGLGAMIAMGLFFASNLAEYRTLFGLAAIIIFGMLGLMILKRFKKD